MQREAVRGAAMTTADTREQGDPRLLTRVSRSMFWNATLLPLIAVSNFALAILIRRHFGLESGRYDVLLGILNTLLFYSGVGLPNCLNRFLAELEVRGEAGRIRSFLLWSGVYRFAILAAVGLSVYLAAERLSAFLSLGPDGAGLLRILLLLVFARAMLDFVHRSLQGLLHHLHANVAQLVQAVLAPALVLGAMLAADALRLYSVFPLLAVAAATAALLGALWLRRSLRELPSAPATVRPPAGRAAEPTTRSGFGGALDPGRVWGYALFMFAFDISNYFVGPGFINPALLVALGDEAPVAMFNVGLQLPLMITVLVVSSFQGLYRPLFARLLAESDAGRLRTAFYEVSKVQAFLLLPSAAGLAVVADDLIPLAFGIEFQPAARIATALSLLLALETLFNLGTILLSTAQRYRPVAISQGLRLLMGPLFVLAAVSSDLLVATIVFGVGRVAAKAVGYVYAQRAYRVQFPWWFVLRLAVPVALMGGVVIALGLLWPMSWTSLLARVLAGAGVFGVGVRFFRILGPREVDLLQRANLPGGSHIIRWLIPSG